MWPTTMLAKAGLLLCLVVGSRQLSITELVVPSQLRSGDNVELECRIDRGEVPYDALIVKWWFTPLNDSDSHNPLQLYQRLEKGAPQAPHHKHFNTQIKNNDSIVLVNATPAISGTYGCEVSYDLIEIRKYKELTVFSPGTGPQLNITEVEDGPDDDTVEDVLILCRADDVAPVPDLAIKIDGKEMITTDDLDGPDPDGLYDVLSTITMSKAAVDGTGIVCELYYHDTNIVHEPYVDTKYYGEPPTTEPPEDASQPDATSNSLPYQSGDSCACRASWALLFLLSILTQMPSLL